MTPEQFEKHVSKIESILDGFRDKYNHIDTEKALHRVKAYFRCMCAEGGELDPRPRPDQMLSTGEPNWDGEAEPAAGLFRYAAMKFIELGKPYATFDILTYAWQSFNIIQKQCHKKVYKGALGLWLVDFYRDWIQIPSLQIQVAGNGVSVGLSPSVADIGAAIRWALLTHADDALVSHNRLGAGTQHLRYSFGMSELALRDFNKLIDQYKPDRATGDWSKAVGFADDMLVRFALCYPQHVHLFAIPTSVVEFPICKPYLEVLWNNAQRPDKGNRINGTCAQEDENKNTLERDKAKKEAYAKGKALEHLAAYLFLLIPGLIPQQNVEDLDSHSDHDLVVHNLRPSDNLEAEIFGRSFLVECKNLQNPVSVEQVGYFLYRMRMTHSKFRVIFAPNDVSGSGGVEKVQDKFARNLIRRLFQQDGMICIVLNEADIKDILNQRTTFRSRLMEEANKLRFGLPKSSNPS